MLMLLLLTMSMTTTTTLGFPVSSFPVEPSVMLPSVVITGSKSRPSTTTMPMSMPPTPRPTTAMVSSLRILHPSQQVVCRKAGMKNPFLLSVDSDSRPLDERHRRCDEKRHDEPTSIERTICSRWKELLLRKKTRMIVAAAAAAASLIMRRLVVVDVVASKNSDIILSSSKQQRRQRNNRIIDCIHQKTTVFLLYYHLKTIVRQAMKNLRRTFMIVLYSFVLLFGGSGIFFTSNGTVRPSVQQCHASQSLLPSSPSCTTVQMTTTTTTTTTELVPSSTMSMSLSTTTDTPRSESDHTVLVATADTNTASSEPARLVESEQDKDEERNENVYSTTSPVEEEEHRNEGEDTKTKLGEQCDSSDDDSATTMDVAAAAATDDETNSNNHDVVETTGNSPTAVIGAKGHDDREGENFIAPAVAAVVGSGTVFLLRKQNNIPPPRSGDQENDYDETIQKTVQGEKKVTVLATAGAVAVTSQKTELLLPLMNKKYIDARSQPKSVTEESALADKYSSIPDVGDRAFQILLDLGMIESTSFVP